jgi:hypothetical protein
MASLSVRKLLAWQIKPWPPWSSGIRKGMEILKTRQCMRGSFPYGTENDQPPLGHRGTLAAVL